MSIEIRPLDVREHAALVQGWLSDPRSAFWRMTELTVDEVADYFRVLADDPHQNAWIGWVDGIPLFLVETYDPAHVLLTDVHDAVAGDLGMHLLVAPPGAEPIPGLTSAVMLEVVTFLFERLGAKRIVVEPDVRNLAVAAKNAEVGFRVIRDVELSDKLARLSILTPDDLAASHLRPATMARAHRHLVAKALAEFTHERLLAPTAVDGASENGASQNGASHEVRLDEDRVIYRFTARRHALEHWVIDEGSLMRTVDGIETPLDALALIVELQPLLLIPEALLATYLEEVSSTLASAAFKLHRPRPRASALVSASFQQIEAAMTEGHPAFVANNGRIGFGLGDFHAYAPESARPIRLLWLAARRELANLALGVGLNEAGHYESELGAEQVAQFVATLAALGLDPGDYRYLPVHPWQFQHRIAVTFARDLAQRDLVLLGEGRDEYQAQQSIRTFFNRSRPARDYVKTALAIQNMGFLRGLSPAYMRPTPAINDWVADLVAADSTLTAAGFSILREHATIGYTGDVYHRATASSPHRKMVAALWRESPVTKIGPHERLATMASLLHRDARGESLVAALVEASGVSAESWLRSYLDAYLLPIVHCLRAHDLAFMPHGENLILVLENNVPTRVFMKDIGEEIAVLAEREVPTEVRRIISPVDDREKALAVFTDVFDGVFRYLAAIFADDGLMSGQTFWRLVSECVDRHDSEHPDLAGRIDLRAARFDHSCLNRLQLRNTLQMVDLGNQSQSLIYAGTLANPISRAS